MSKTHITLVGGQPIPVYLGIQYAQANQVLFICSFQTRNEAKRVDAEIAVSSEIIELDPVDLEKIVVEVSRLAESLQDNEVSINISGGTKLWAYYFASIFAQHPNSTLFYVDQNNKIWNLTDRSHHTVDLDMGVRFRLHGNPLKDFHRIGKYAADDFAAIQPIRNIRKFSPGEFTQLVLLCSNAPNINKHTTRNGSILEWNKEDKEFTIRLFRRNGASQVEVLHSPQIFHLIHNSGWFELEVAQMLSEWGRVKEMRLNCIFPTKTNSPKNEIDIIIDTGTKLLFVECKTQINSETDIDKFAAAVKVYGGSGSKALFVTDAPMRDKAKEKCNDNGILSFSLEEYGGATLSKRPLFELLEKELFNINP